MMIIRTMPAAKFKAQCLKIMDDVRATCEPVVITKKGRPVATPVTRRQCREGSLRLQANEWWRVDRGERRSSSFLHEFFGLTCSVPRDTSHHSTVTFSTARSEERRVGKECRRRPSTDQKREH